MTSNEIKKYLATKLNAKPSDFSVRKQDCLYSDAYYIYIKQAHINIDDVERLARAKFECVDRDEHTGEILSGGNTFIFVEYDNQAYEQVSDQFNKNLLNAIVSKWFDKVKGSELVEFAPNMWYKIAFDENRKEKYIQFCANYPKKSIDYVQPAYAAVTLLRYGYFRDMCEFINKNA